MKIGVFYASKYGTTKEAVEIMKNALEEKSLEVEIYNIEKNNLDSSKLDSFDLILIGGSIYMGRLQKTIINFCEKNKEQILEKKFGLFLCCGSEKDFEEQLSSNLPDELINQALIKGYFGYGYHLESMNFIYRKIIKKVGNITSSENSIKEEAIREYTEQIMQKIK